MSDFRENNFGFWMIFLFVIIFPVNSVNAFLFPENISGYYHITGVDSRTGDTRSLSLNQEYSIFWKKQLLPYIETRAYMRYHNFGMDQGLGANVWREDFQPSGEISWNHPYFSANANLTRQKSSSNNGTTDLVRDNFSVGISSKPSDYPSLTVRYYQNHTYNKLNRKTRDTRKHQFNLNTNYKINISDFYYGLTFINNKNSVTGVGINELQHVFRWSQFSTFLGNKLQLGSDYNLKYRSQTTEKSLQGDAYKQIPVFRSLYAYDSSPDFGELDTLNSLGDGNLADPTSPSIDIGAGLIERNIGVDLGYEQDISAIYIYVDRPSGSQLIWTVYVSSDNLSWSRFSDNVSSNFNLGFNRYEIIVPSLNTRYVKAVNSGINDIITVYVTEITALVQLPDTETVTESQAVHTADIVSAYKISKTLQSNVSLTYKNEPKGDFRNSKSQFYYTFSLRHNPRANITQLARFQAGFDRYNISGIKDKNRQISYSLITRPIETLGFSFSASNQSNSQNENKERETNSAFIRADGNILRGLDLQGEFGYSRIKRFAPENIFDVWVYRLSAAGTFIKSLDFASSFSYQSSRDDISRVTRKRRQINLNADYRLTKAILIRSLIYLNNDNGLNNLSHEYNISWNIGKTINLGGSARILKNAGNIRTERYGVRMNIRLSARTTVSINSTRQNYSLGNQADVMSIQAGLKSGF